MRGPARPACLSRATTANPDWPAHGGDAGHTQSSALAQITTANVSRLQVAWTYRSGDARPEGRSQIQCNPIVVRGVLYGTSPQLKVFALDAATGVARWTFDPFAGEAEPNALGVNRGVVFWESGEDQRILVAAGQRLYALDARTGKPVPSFGQNGSASLKEGLGERAQQLYVLSNTPGAIYQDLLIIGTRLSEGPGPSAPGHIRAFDVRTGRVRWVFKTIPAAGRIRLRHLARRRLDAHRRRQCVERHLRRYDAGPGVPADRLGGLRLLGRQPPRPEPVCQLAARAQGGHGRTGVALPVRAPRFVGPRPAIGARAGHGDHDGRRVDAVAQTTKSGHVFLFNRETGVPLFPIEEHPVPASDLKGESAWPTQPLPVKPPAFSRQAFTEADVTDVSEASRAAVLAQLAKVRTGRQFIPPSAQGTVIFPGFDGGAEWGGAAFDADSGLLYVNGNEMPWILSMVEIDHTKESTDFARGRRTYQLNCTACHGVDRQGDPAKVFPSLVTLPKKMPRAEADKIIAGGKAVMPAFPAFSAQGAPGAAGVSLQRQTCPSRPTTMNRWRRASRTRTPGTTGSSIPKGIQRSNRPGAR